MNLNPLFFSRSYRLPWKPRGVYRPSSTWCRYDSIKSIWQHHSSLRGPPQLSNSVWWSRCYCYSDWWLGGCETRSNPMAASQIQPGFPNYGGGHSRPRGCCQLGYVIQTSIQHWWSGFHWLFQSETSFYPFFDNNDSLSRTYTAWVKIQWLLLFTVANKCISMLSIILEVVSEISFSH